VRTSVEMVREGLIDRKQGLLRIEPDLLEQLLFAKQQATRNRDHRFEQLLLETGKVCDERIRDGAPLTLLWALQSRQCLIVACRMR